MGYHVQVVGPAGRVTYLRRGKEVSSAEEATWYPHPSNAKRAAEAYRKRVAGQRVLVDILDWEAEGV
jgi:hypothetical protein